MTSLWVALGQIFQPFEANKMQQGQKQQELCNADYLFTL